MAKSSSDQKKTLKGKILELRKKGLQIYGADLDRQLKAAGTSNLKKVYRGYLEKEIARNNERIEKIDKKLK
jgi:hypothetical protein